MKDSASQAVSSSTEDRFINRGWRRKFAVALRGIVIGIARTGSFVVHVPIAIAALILAMQLNAEPWQWVALVTSIGMVMVAELLNSSIETISRAITREEHPFIRDALDIAAGAVLVAALTAVALGLIALAPSLWQALSA